MNLTKWLPFAKAKRLREMAKKRDATKPLTGKEVEKLLRSGKLTKEQAIELRRRYMDSQEYKEEQSVTWCGGIRPLPVIPAPDEKD